MDKITDWGTVRFSLDPLYDAAELQVWNCVGCGLKLELGSMTPLWVWRRRSDEPHQWGLCAAHTDCARALVEAGVAARAHKQAVEADEHNAGVRARNAVRKVFGVDGIEEPRMT